MHKELTIKRSSNEEGGFTEDILSDYTEKLSTNEIGDLAIIKFRGTKPHWLVLRVEKIIELNGRNLAVINYYFTNIKPDSQIKLNSIFKDEIQNTYDPRLVKCFETLTYTVTREELSTTTFKEMFWSKDDWQITSELNAFDIENYIEVYNFSKQTQYTMNGDNSEQTSVKDGKIVSLNINGEMYHFKIAQSVSESCITEYNIKEFLYQNFNSVLEMCNVKNIDNLRNVVYNHKTGLFEFCKSSSKNDSSHA